MKRKELDFMTGIHYIARFQHWCLQCNRSAVGIRRERRVDSVLIAFVGKLGTRDKHERRVGG